MKKTEMRQVQKEERSKSKRQRIIDAAITVFFEKGYQNADVQSIAEMCSVGKGTIYLYFKGKEDLFWGTGIYICEKIAEFLNCIKEQTSDPLERLGLFFEMMANFINEHISYISIINQVRSMPKEKTPDPINRIKELCMDEFLCGLFRQAMDEGIVPKGDPRSYTISIINSIWGIITFYHHENDALSLPERVRQTFHFFLNGIKKQEKNK